jgi:hypothetical protein
VRELSVRAPVRRVGLKKPSLVIAGGVAHGGGVSENLLHPRVRIEGLALHDTDGRQLAEKFGIKRGGRLHLHELVDHLEIGKVIWGNGVE